MSTSAPSIPNVCPACGAATAETAPDTDTLRTGATAHALREVLDGNDVFVSTHDPNRFSGFQESQTPFVTLLTCADSRVSQSVFNFDPFNRVFEICDIGNQLRPVAGSIDYGVRHLKTPLLMVMGHVRCGAVKAAMGDYAGESFAIMNELDELHLPLRGDDPSVEFETRWLANVERNVDFQVGLCTRRYRDLILKGSLAVLGAVYDFANLYDRGHGRVVLVNLNGSSDVEEIRASPFLSGIQDTLVQTTVSRINQPTR